MPVYTGVICGVSSLRLTGPATFHLPSRRPFSTTAASSKEEGGVEEQGRKRERADRNYSQVCTAHQQHFPLITCTDGLFDQTVFPHEHERMGSGEDHVTR